MSAESRRIESPVFRPLGGTSRTANIHEAQLPHRRALPRSTSRRRDPVWRTRHFASQMPSSGTPTQTRLVHRVCHILAVRTPWGRGALSPSLSSGPDPCTVSTPRDWSGLRPRTCGHPTSAGAQPSSSCGCTAFPRQRRCTSAQMVNVSSFHGTYATRSRCGCVLFLRLRRYASTGSSTDVPGPWCHGDRPRQQSISRQVLSQSGGPCAIRQGGRLHIVGWTSRA